MSLKWVIRLCTAVIRDLGVLSRGSVRLGGTVESMTRLCRCRRRLAVNWWGLRFILTMWLTMANSVVLL